MSDVLDRINAYLANEPYKSEVGNKLLADAQKELEVSGAVNRLSAIAQRNMEAQLSTALKERDDAVGLLGAVRAELELWLERLPQIKAEPRNLPWLNGRARALLAKINANGKPTEPANSPSPVEDAVAAEREACAQVAETMGPDDDRLDRQVRREVAAAIRARASSHPAPPTEATSATGAEPVAYPSQDANRRSREKWNANHPAQPAGTETARPKRKFKPGDKVHVAGHGSVVGTVTGYIGGGYPLDQEFVRVEWPKNYQVVAGGYYEQNVAPAPSSPPTEPKATGDLIRELTNQAAVNRNRNARDWKMIGGMEVGLEASARLMVEAAAALAAAPSPPKTAVTTEAGSPREKNGRPGSTGE